ncbi:MAG: hypothetical protein KatS3mg090_0617 [Patescibacteria group bacterium]|nr:MAG: hypothetical protein KatS3mg090_0617 [Patescibacteria group bacterium]
MRIFATKKSKMFLIAIFFLGLLIRLYNLKDNFFFSYDQARDAQRVFEIITNKDIKIVGPETDIIGIHHGPLHYYLTLPFYFLSKFDPNITVFLFVLLNMTVIIPLYLIAKLIFRKDFPALLTSFLWSISFAQLNYARFISNAAPMSLGATIFFLGLIYYLFNKQKTKYLFISVLGLVLSINFNFMLVYLIIFYPLIYILFKLDKNKYLSDLKKSLFLFLILTSNFIIAEIKWNFIGIKSLLNYLTSGSNHLNNQFYSFVINYLGKLENAIVNSFFFINPKLALAFFLILLILCYKSINDKNRYKLIILWLFSTFPLFMFKTGIVSFDFINNPIYPVLTLTIAGGIYFIIQINKLLGYALIIFILISNFINIKNDEFKNIKVIEVQRITLKDEKDLIDYTYKEANNKEFSICAVTNPLFINTTWSFLYKFYGEKRYGYLPFWSGPDQHLNTSYLPYDTKRPELKFLILEPEVGIPDYAIKATLFLEDHRSKLIEEKKFGETIVQKRVLLPKPKELDLKKADELKLKDIISNDPRYSCYR